jgi:cadmium resistance protein CadD (predicted permease)
MLDVLGIVAIAAFAATDIDDLFLLMMFFSSRIYPARQVVIGQHLGIGALVSVSIIGSLIALVIPTYIIGLLGMVPIAIGIKELIDTKKDESPSMQTIKRKRKNRSYLAFLTVAAVTISNGGDNIGVYVPLFSKYSTAGQITMVTAILVTAIFITMTAVWCTIAYYLVNHPLLASRVRRIGNIIMPFALIGLGIYILIDSFLIL